VDGLLSETTRDVINLVSLGIGLLSLLLALLGRRRVEPRASAKTTSRRTSSAVQEYINSHLGRTFLLIEMLMLAFGLVFWLPQGTTRTILGILALGVLVAQLWFLYQALLYIIGSEAFDGKGHWLYPIVFVIIIFSTSTLLSSGITQTPFRSYVFFQLMLPSFVSACGLFTYLAYQIMMFAGHYGERKKSR
jgi:hypothetical protein